MASLVSWLKFAGARTSTGATVATGTATFYVPGSSVTKVDIFSDSYGSVPLANPVTLDAAGRAEVWVSDPCDIVIKDSGGVNVSLVSSEAFGGHSITAAQTEVVSDYFTGQHGVDYDVALPVPLSTVIDRIGASIGIDGQYKESSTTGMVARDVHDVLSGLCVTPYDFGANGGGSADDTLPVQRAIDRAAALGVPCYLGSGIYRITSGLTITAESHIVGAGKGKSVIRSTSDAYSMITVSTAAGRRAGERFNWTLRDFSIEAPYGTDANNYGITANIDTVPLAGGGATIENVDVAAGFGIDVWGASNVRIVNCNVVAQRGTEEAVGIETGAYSSVVNCIVDGVEFSASHVSTGIKLGAYSSAERCYIKNCTVGGENKIALVGSTFRNCEAYACGTSFYARANNTGCESCTSSSQTVATFKADAALTSIISRNNSWDQPFLVTASDLTTDTSAGVSDVTDLTLNLIANVTYDIEMELAFTAGASEGIKLSTSGGTATFASAIKPRIGIQTNGTAGVAAAGYTVGGPTPLDMTGPTAGFATVRYIATCATSGTFFPQVLQSSAGATAAVLKTGSWVRARVV